MNRYGLGAGALGMLLSLAQVFAGSATWLSAPVNGDWNMAVNWTPGGPPNGSVDLATFGFSSITALSLSAQTQVGSVAFSPGASAYTISSSSGFALTMSGLGIANNSGVTQTFVVAGSDGLIRFT